MAADIQNLTKVITDKISTASTAQDVLFLTKALEKLGTGYFISVTNYSQLPDPTTLKIGSLYYVVNDKRMYYVSSDINRPAFWKEISTVSSNKLVYTWGQNNRGQLADNTETNRSSPISIVGNINDWTKVSMGCLHSLFLRQDGTLWAAGEGCYGVLGNGTTTVRNSPTSVIGGIVGWLDVSAGSNHSAGINSNGVLWSWGAAVAKIDDDPTIFASGQLGDGTTVNKCSPVSVAGGFTDWCQVSAGSLHTAAVRRNGTLWTWGLNGFILQSETPTVNGIGSLGDGTTTARCSPVSVLGGFTDWCQVSAGRTHTAAVRNNGTLWTWGRNNSGQLGDNTSVNNCSPVSVIGGFNDWCQVSAGWLNTAAVRRNGTLWVWGDGTSGKLGNNCTNDRSSPVSVVGGFTDWCQVSVGCSHTLALRTNGTLWSWGCNSVGNLGINTTANRSSPVSVVGGFTDWCQVSSGFDVSAAIRERV